MDDLGAKLKAAIKPSVVTLKLICNSSALPSYLRLSPNGGEGRERGGFPKI